MMNYYFDTKEFLEQITPAQFPFIGRTEENLKAIEGYANLFYVTQAEMVVFVEKVWNLYNDFNQDYLENLCIYRDCMFIKLENTYDIPCMLFLMNRDRVNLTNNSTKKLLCSLYFDYKLTPPVINVIMEQSLNRYSNNIVRGHIIALAIDMNKNSISTAEEALQRIENTNHARRNPENNEGACPFCGGPTYKKIGVYGEFIACSNYPSCRYTRSVNYVNERIKRIGDLEIKNEEYPTTYNVVEMLIKNSYSDDVIKKTLASLKDELQLLLTENKEENAQ